VQIRAVAGILAPPTLAQPQTGRHRPPARWLTRLDKATCPPRDANLVPCHGKTGRSI